MITEKEKEQIFYENAWTTKNTGLNMDLCIDINTDLKRRFLPYYYTSIEEAEFMIKKIHEDILNERF